MRMRKKKHGAERMDACRDIWITEPNSLKGNWKSLAPDKELCIEIGCGKGGFISEMAKRHPDCFFIAFELIPNVIVTAMECVQKEKIENVRFVCCNAETLRDIFEENEVSGIYLNFSDPWPKKRHAKRRLMHRAFLETYRHILKDGGTLTFKTDNRPLFDFALEELEAAGIPMSELTYDLHNSEYNAENIMTEYEKNFSEKGFSINRVVGHIHKK